MNNKQPLYDLPNEMFVHPEDYQALKAVKKIPGLEKVTRKFLEIGLERYYYIQNIADNVRVGPNQLKNLYKIFCEMVNILDVPEPELYLRQDPVANAFTFGSEKPYIVLNSGLMDLLTEEELRVVIAHELGHIKADHVLYKMIARIITQLVAMVGQMTFGIGSLLGTGLVVALYKWDRKSELTADRASLLVVQDRDLVVNALMKLAGGSRKVYEQMDKDAFLEQAKAYEDLDDKLLEKVYKFIHLSFRSHPFLVYRAKQIMDWSEGNAYKDIIQGNYKKDSYVHNKQKKAKKGEYTILRCKYCKAKNRIASNKDIKSAKCGKCGRNLY